MERDLGNVGMKTPRMGTEYYDLGIVGVNAICIHLKWALHLHASFPMPYPLITRLAKPMFPTHSFHFAESISYTARFILDAFGLRAVPQARYTYISISRSNFPNPKSFNLRDREDSELAEPSPCSHLMYYANLFHKDVILACQSLGFLPLSAR